MDKNMWSVTAAHAIIQNIVIFHIRVFPVRFLGAVIEGSYVQCRLCEKWMNWSSTHTRVSMNINIALVFITMTLSKGPQRSHRRPSSNMDNTRITTFFFPQDVSRILRNILSNVSLRHNCCKTQQQLSNITMDELLMSCSQHS